MRGAMPTSPPSLYLHGMAFNYVQDKLMLSNDFPSFDSTMSVSRLCLFAACLGWWLGEGEETSW